MNANVAEGDDGSPLGPPRYSSSAPALLFSFAPFRDEDVGESVGVDVGRGRERDQRAAWKEHAARSEPGRSAEQDLHDPRCAHDLRHEEVAVAVAVDVTGIRDPCAEFEFVRCGTEDRARSDRSAGATEIDREETVAAVRVATSDREIRRSHRR